MFHICRMQWFFLVSSNQQSRKNKSHVFSFLQNSFSLIIGWFSFIFNNFSFIEIVNSSLRCLIHIMIKFSLTLTFFFFFFIIFVFFSLLIFNRYKTYLSCQIILFSMPIDVIQLHAYVFSFLFRFPFHHFHHYHSFLLVSSNRESWGWFNSSNQSIELIWFMHLDLLFIKYFISYSP